MGTHPRAPVPDARHIPRAVPVQSEFALQGSEQTLPEAA